MWYFFDVFVVPGFERLLERRSLGGRRAAGAQSYERQGIMRICAIIAVIALLVVPVAAQRHIEFLGSPILDPIPPDCSDWHELHPNFCYVDHQDGYEDNGDGVVSACDVIILGGVRYHIDWAGPTYWLVPVAGGDEHWVEPSEPTGGDPTGEIWHEVYPVFCQEWEVVGWEDNGDGVLSECDMVTLADGITYHIAEIGLNIEVTEEPSPVEQSTWGKIKSMFGF